MLKTSAVKFRLIFDDRLKYCKNVHKFCKHSSTSTASETPKTSDFESMIIAEKQKAKGYFVLKDNVNVLPLLDKQNVSQMLDSEVHRLYKWTFRDHRCALIEMKDKDYVLRQEIRRDLGYRSGANLANINALRFIALQTLSKGLAKSLMRPKDGQNGSILKLESQRKDNCWNVNYLREVNMTNQQLVQFLLKHKSTSDLDLKLRFYIVNQLESFICHSIFKDHKLLPFGSTIAGIGSPFSDLDMVLVPQKLTQSDSQYEDRQKLMNNLNLIADLLQTSVPFYSNFFRILKARIPIIKFVFDFAPIDLDLSIEVSQLSVHHGVSMAAFIHYCHQLNPQVKDLIHLVKIWANQHKLVKPRYWAPHMVYNGCTSFQLTALVLYFLQRNAMIPPMACFLEQSTDTFKPVDTNTDTIQLLLEFFEFVAAQEFEWEALSILRGTSYPNPDNSPIYMENPFDLNRNMCMNVIRTKMDRLAEVSAVCAQIMAKPDFSLVDILEFDVQSPTSKKSRPSNRSIVSDALQE